MENYYEMLGVRQSSTNEEIRKAYINILKKYHPDIYKGDNAIAEKITAEINLAYDTLLDPEKRIKYNNFLNEKKPNVVDNFQNKSSVKTHFNEDVKCKKYNDCEINKNKIKNNNKNKTKNINKFNNLKSNNNLKENTVNKHKKSLNAETENSESKLNFTIFLIFVSILILIIVLNLL